MPVEKGLASTQENYGAEEQGDGLQIQEQSEAEEQSEAGGCSEAEEQPKTVLDVQSLLSLNEGRRQTYTLLSRLYRSELAESDLSALKERRFPAQTGSEKADEGYRLIARYLSNMHAGSVDELALDYARTFVGEGMDNFSAAYPYESVHTSEKRLLMQDARDEVLLLMKSEGIKKEDECHETEDHIALELEFMGILARRAADALRSGDEDAAADLFLTQRNFLNDHLLSWVPLLTQAMRKFAKSDFYQGISRLTDGFLDADKAFLDHVLADDAA